MGAVPGQASNGSYGTQEGEVLVASEDSLVLRTDDDGRVSIPMHEDRTIQVRIVRSAGRRAAVGAGVGALAGVFLAAVTWDESDQGLVIISQSDAAAVFAITGAGLGAVIGGLSGFDTWETVRGPRVSVGYAPEGDAVSVGLTIRR